MYREQAKALDKSDDLRAASEAYEHALAGNELDLGELIDLAVLYFVCADDAYAASKRYDRSFVERASKRATQVLDEAERRFGVQDEVEFWRGYFDFVAIGDPAQTDRWKEIAAAAKTLVPSFVLFSSGDRVQEEYREDAKKLLEIVSDGATAKKRYILSILKSRLAPGGADLIVDRSHGR